jgi:transposase
MWNPTNRRRMAGIEKKTRRYPTDLTDEEWDRMAAFLPKGAKNGRRSTTDLREVLNAIRYIARAGCGWRMLPKDFPPWQTVYWWFQRFMRRFLFETIHDMAVMLDRERVGREASPSAGAVGMRGGICSQARTLSALGLSKVAVTRAIGSAERGLITEGALWKSLPRSPCCAGSKSAAVTKPRAVAVPSVRFSATRSPPRALTTNRRSPCAAH